MGTETMRAVVLDRYGPPERVLRVARTPRPEPGPGEVLVRVRATSLNAWDVDLVTGAALVRLGAPFRPGVRVIGSDVAGEIVAVGDGVERHRVGDRVAGELSGCGWGGFAEYAVATEDALVPIPQGVDDLTAAALPQAASMAFQALGELAELRGRRVLVVGAGGGVGTFAVQLAAHAGAAVTVVDRAEKLDALRELGAESAVEPGQLETGQLDAPDRPAASARFDRVLDVVGALAPAVARRLLAPGGVAVVIGGRPRRILQVALAASRGADGEGRSLRLLGAVPNRDLPELLGLAQAGSLRAIVDGPHPLEAAPREVERLRAGRVIGKVVLVPG